MSNKFREYIAVDRNQFNDMVTELEQLKKETLTESHVVTEVIESENKKDKPEVVQPPEMDVEFVRLLQSLPPKSRESAKQILKHLLDGNHFGYDTASGELVCYLPDKGWRYRVHGSNLYDILNFLCRQTPPSMSHQQQFSTNTYDDGMKTMLDMLVLTPLGSSQIVDVNLRKLFQDCRKRRK